MSDRCHLSSAAATLLPSRGMRWRWLCNISYVNGREINRKTELTFLMVITRKNTSPESLYYIAIICEQPDNQWDIFDTDFIYIYITITTISMILMKRQGKSMRNSSVSMMLFPQQITNSVSSHPLHTVNGSMQSRSIPSALAIQTLQSCAEPSNWCVLMDFDQT